MPARSSSATLRTTLGSVVKVSLDAAMSKTGTIYVGHTSIAVFA